jgi:hypothetical protein
MSTSPINYRNRAAGDERVARRLNSTWRVEYITAMGFMDTLRRMFGGGGDDLSAAKQEGDVHALDREDDPRGGVQSPEYRHAEPTDVVEDAGVGMSGPAGTPQEGTTVEERRFESEEKRDSGDDPERRVD